MEQAAAEAAFKDMDGRRVMTSEGQSILDTMQAMAFVSKFPRSVPGICLGLTSPPCNEALI